MKIAPAQLDCARAWKNSTFDEGSARRKISDAYGDRTAGQVDQRGQKHIRPRLGAWN
jgi:hypothetical protein